MNLLRPVDVAGRLSVGEVGLSDVVVFSVGVNSSVRVSSLFVCNKSNSSVLVSLSFTGDFGVVFLARDLVVPVNGSVSLAGFAGSFSFSEFSSLSLSCDVSAGLDFFCSYDVFSSVFVDRPGAPLFSTDVYYDYRSLILNMQGSAGSTTFTDSSPNNFTVTPYGNAQLATVPGESVAFLTAASFDGGSNTNLTVPANTAFAFGTGDFTIELFFQIPIGASAAPYGKILVSNENNNWSAGAFALYGLLNTSAFRPAFWINEYSSSSPILVPSTGDYRDGIWHHLAIVRLGSSFKMYIDGVSVASGTHAGNCGSSTRNLVLADNLANNSGDRNLLGLIGPLRISPWAVYKSNFTPSANLFPAAPDSIYANPYYDKVALSLKFDGTNGSTSFVDTGPNAFAVTPSGNAQITSASKYGSGAGAFDGSGDRLDLASNAAFGFGTGDFTVEAWIYLNSVNYNYTQVLPNVPVSGGFSVYYTGPGNYYGVGANSIIISNRISNYGSIPFTWNTNTWYHMAISRSNGSLRVFMNGSQVGSTITNTPNYATGGLNIGGNTDNAAHTVNGSIDELEITPGVAKYKANFTPPVRGLSTIYNPYTTLPVSGAALWLDGADSSTLFTDAGVTPVAKSGDLIYQWSDKSGNNRHATQATSASRPTWVPPASGRNGLGALAFNGSSQFLNLANDPIGTNDFTIEFWMKQAATTNSYWVILDSRISGNALGYPVILYNNSSTNLSFYNNGWLLSGSVSTATWTHIAFTRSSGTIRMFINGVLASSNTDTSSYSTFRQIGKAFDPYYFNGQIQNLLIYNGQALYTSNFTPWMS